MSVSAIDGLARCRLYFQAVAAPFRCLYAVFLRAMSYLFCCFQTKWRFLAVRIENQCESIFTGIVRFGRRFLVYSDNHGRVLSSDLNAYQKKQYCRGNCYHLIDLRLRNPSTPLSKLAQAFEQGTPQVAAELHDCGALPQGIQEERLWSCRNPDWNQLSLPQEKGMYTFLIGFSEDEETHTAAHRIALFIEKEETYFFDPFLGLVLYSESRWKEHLQWIASKIQTSHKPTAFHVLECSLLTIARRES